MLQGKKILLGVTGSIAAYKTATLVRLLVKAGAEVQVLMTPEATGFITPLTLSTLSRRPALHALEEEGSWNNHVALGRWADIMLIAPASANTLAKMAAGLCDNLLLAVYLSAACPVMIAPAMDEDMWHHPATARNVRLLREAGHLLLPVEAGELASGLVGEGRMSEPEHITGQLENYFKEAGALKGKTALVTAGPTYESIDPVRFIGNHSSGKMGIAIADELAARGAAVELVLGPSGETPGAGVRVTRVKTAAEMWEACLRLFRGADITVMAAAVADYRPAAPADKKIKKEAGPLQLSLEKTGDILRELGSLKRARQFLVGFALETDDEEIHALKKLKEKNLDLIVLNSLRDAGAGFTHDTNKVTLFTADGQKRALPLKTKQEVAADVVRVIEEALAGH
jgi:phosphopantothenoylcysteine decarboxylase/phosphopantothenate--cysteine ligase